MIIYVDVPLIHYMHNDNRFYLWSSFFVKLLSTSEFFSSFGLVSLPKCSFVISYVLLTYLWSL